MGGTLSLSHIRNAAWPAFLLIRVGSSGIAMSEPSPIRFVLPEHNLINLPTGSVKVVVEALGRRIAGGEFAEGDHIPKEPDLSKMFGVSRTVVREAVKVLSGKGMVRTARRYGTRVCPFEEWNLLDPDVIQWHGPDSPMAVRIYRETTDLRFLLEPESAALAALNGSEAQKLRILDAARMIRTDLYGKEGMLAADYAFHSTILEATGNLLLRQMQGLILALMKFSYATGSRAVADDGKSRAMHLAVARAIVAGDPDGARRHMSDMLAYNQRAARRYSRKSG